MPEEALETMGGVSSETAVPLNLRFSLPTKRRVNLAKVTRKKVQWHFIALAAFAVIFLCRAFVNYAIIARFDALREAQTLLEETHQRFDAAEATLNQYYESRDVYVHVTWNDMTAQEIAMVDPSDVAGLLERMILPVSPLESWSLSGNAVTLSVRCDSLETVNNLARRLREEPMIEYCSVRNGSAAASEQPDVSAPGLVTSQVEIRFRDADNTGGNKGN